MIDLWPSHRQQGSLHDQGPEVWQGHRLNGPCDISGSNIILQRYENTFVCAKKTKIQTYSQTICLLRVHPCDLRMNNLRINFDTEHTFTATYSRSDD